MNRRTSGFSLVEVTLAVGITAFCLVAIFGLLPIGLNTNRAAYEQTAALHAASSLIADIQATPRGSNISQIFRIATPNRGQASIQTPVYLSEGGIKTNAGAARFLALVTVTPAQNTNLRVPDRVHVMMTWPALANPGLSSPGPNLRAGLTNTAGWVETATAVERL